MKRIAIVLAAGLLCAGLMAQQMPEDGKYYRIKHSSGLYLTRGGGNFVLAPNSDQAPVRHGRDGRSAQVFRFVKTPDAAPVYNIEVDNWRYLTSDPNWRMHVYGNNATNYAKFEVSPTTDGSGLLLKNLGQRNRHGDGHCCLGADGDQMWAKVFTNKSGASADHQWTLEEVEGYAFADPGLGADVYPGQELPDSDPRKHAYPGYKLVFAEEFNDEDGQPSKDVWKYEYGWMRNHEDQFYWDNKNNIWTEGGACVFNGRREPAGETKNPFYGADRRNRHGRPEKEHIDWTSASIITKGEPQGGYSWQYGIYEVRAKVPAIEGTWPAIWSTGQQYQWPKGGEIDLMEWYQNQILGNVCWGNQSWNSKTVPMDVLNASENDGDWAGKYHVWRMIWDPAHIEMWCDDVLVNDIDLNATVNPDEEGQEWAGVNPFRDVRQCLWLNLALGGDNGGSLENCPDNNYYLVDYARVYQKIGSDGKAAYHVDPYGPDATMTEPAQR